VCNVRSNLFVFKAYSKHAQCIQNREIGKHTKSAIFCGFDKKVHKIIAKKISNFNMLYLQVLKSGRDILVPDNQVSVLCVGTLHDKFMNSNLNSGTKLLKN
jgi:hypothetical protein